MKRAGLQPSGAVVLVTGASSGIGRAIAMAFGNAGARVAVAARRADFLNEVAAAADCLAIPTDLSDESAAIAMVDRTVGHFGRIDVLVNNAAVIVVSRADEVSSDELIQSFRTNVVGPIAATNRALRYMRKQGRGHVINIGSPGFLIGIPLYTPYVCSKAAMSGWTRTIQAEWEGTGIVVSEYFPGYVTTGSPAVSRYGAVAQDAIIEPERKGIATLFIRPKTPEQVARQILRLVQRPRVITYSSRIAALGSWIANIPSRRIAIASGMARAVRKRLGLSVFSD